MAKAKGAPSIEFKGLLSFLILHELSGERLYGEQLAERIGARKGDKLTPGTIYPALKKLRKHRLVKWERDGRKKIYRLTDDGRKELRSHYRLFGRYFAGLKERIPARKPKRKAAKKKR